MSKKLHRRMCYSAKKQLAIEVVEIQPGQTVENRICDPTGNWVTIKYTVHGFLGKGGQGKVYKFYDHTQQTEFAAKVISKAHLEKEKIRQKLRSEIKIH
jgi:serine/threonine protein kinase